LNRGLTFRVILAGAALAGLVAGGFVATTIAIRNLRQETRLAARSEQVIAAGNALERSVLDLETGLRGYLLSGRRRFLEPYGDALVRYPAQERELGRLVADDPAQRALLARLETSIDEYIRNWTRPMLARRAHTPERVSQLVGDGGGKRRVDAMRALFDRFINHEQNIDAVRRHGTERTGAVALVFSIAGFVVSTALIALLGLGLHRGVVVPVRRLAGVIAKHRRGELAARVEEGGVAELGELTRAFNVMADELSAQRRQLGTQYAVSTVLADAANVREALQEVLAAISEELGWTGGVAWAPSEAGSGLDLYAAHGDAPRAATKLAAEAWSQRRTMLSEEIPEEPAASGGVAIPIVGSERTLLGVAEFRGVDRETATAMIPTLDSIAAQVAQYIERERADAESVRLKDEFVATVSHELRTPLTAIDGWLTAVLAEELGPLTEEQQHSLTVAKRNSDRLKRVIADLLLAGQIDAGRFTLELGEVRVDELAAETVELLGGLAAQKEIELVLDAPHPVTLSGDRDRLAQLLNNLVSNAIKYTPAGGRVEIRSSARGDHCLLEVRDTGIGIPATERARLFTRFFRASTATETGSAGTGLGLAISKAIVEAHGGTIEARAAQPAGTVIVVGLPISVREPVGAAS